MCVYTIRTTCTYSPTRTMFYINMCFIHMTHPYNIKILCLHSKDANFFLFTATSSSSFFVIILLLCSSDEEEAAAAATTATAPTTMMVQKHILQQHCCNIVKRYDTDNAHVNTSKRRKRGRTKEKNKMSLGNARAFCT